MVQTYEMDGTRKTSMKILEEDTHKKFKNENHREEEKR